MTAARAGGHSYIIKRPRLTKLLDETGARIILLCAPAGYGKTTLAREWAASRSRPVSWYHAGAELADAAAAAFELAAAVGRISNEHELPPRVRDLASTGVAPEVIGREIARVAPTSDALLVIDDYHHAVGSPATERLFEGFVRDAPCQVLITSRIRPDWVAPKQEVYGDALVIGIEALTFNDAEATEILSGRAKRSEYEALLAVAHGWPAVIGMAAVRGPAAFGLEQARLPSEVFDYLASDLLSAVPDEVRDTLFLLALCGDRNGPLVASIVGHRFAGDLAAGIQHGLVTRLSDRDFAVHPLIRSFLVTKLQGSSDAVTISDTATTLLVEARDWDECLNVLQEFPARSVLEQNFLDAVDDLLAAGRITTIGKWIELGRDAQIPVPLILIAEAEIALRQGQDAHAQALAERAAHQLRDDELSIRAHLVAARAAHLRGDPLASKRLSRRAQALSVDSATQAAALWLELVQAVEVADPTAAEIVDELEAIDDPSPLHALRAANARAYLKVEVEGQVREADRIAELAHPLLERVTDALMRTNFLSFRTSTAVYLADFRRAVELSTSLEDDARVSGLDFVLQHAWLHRATAYLGLRNFAAAKRMIDAAESTEPQPSPYLRSQLALKRAQAELTAGNTSRALLFLRGAPPEMIPKSSTGEWLGMKAILHAAKGEFADARSLSAQARASSSHIDAHDLSELADAIAALRQSQAEAAPIVTVVRRLFAAGHLDAVVWASRSFPPIVAAVASAGSDLEHAMTLLLAGSGDIALGRSVGLQMPREFRRTEGLSPREREVHELLAQGRTNRQIAKALFISESTTKVHVQHVFEKLGVHSRAEAARLLRDEPT